MSGQDQNKTSQRSGRPIEQPWTPTIKEITQELEVELSRGLPAAQVPKRRRKYGSNHLHETAVRPWWRILLEQFKSVVIWILSVAAILSLVFGNLLEGLAIAVVIAINTGIGFFSEWRASRSMEALQKIGRPKARVRRGDGEKQVSVESLVPGDVVLLDAGDVIPADCRVAEANSLTVDESALTGESIAVAKRTDPVSEDTPLADRTCMLYKGTTVLEGTGEAVVVATGMATELGRISQLAGEVKEELTPLERRLERLGRRMAVLVLAAAAVSAVAGVFAGHPIRLIIATSIALGVAAVPEALPVVANLALARGMWVMARRNAVINRLPAVETLGATDVIFTDKTGTLTENRMTLRRVVTSAGQTHLEPERQREGEQDDPLVRRAMEIGVLCSNASLGENDDDQGDPTEIALLRAGAQFGMRRNSLLEEKPEVREESFDPERMMMATFHRADDSLEVAVKGAPQAVLEKCTCIATGDEDEPMDNDRRSQWTQRTEELAGEGLRVLGLADRRADNRDEDPYRELRWIGLVGLLDPPREGVADLVDSCHRAGVRVVMVTGDQAQTARAIATQVDIAEEDGPTIRGRDLPDLDNIDDDQRKKVLDTNVFARFSPEQKLDVVDIFQDDGHTVAMTGDGINDAPALKKADIGVAMGQRGTAAAKEVSDMVLLDDAFSSIVSAIRQGRVIFGNIRKSVMFVLCTNIAEVLAVTAASVTGAPLPLLPLQILYLNMLTDALPALALGVSEGSEGIMERSPRSSSESIMTREHWLRLGGWGISIAASVLGAMAVAIWWLGADEMTAVTVSFITLGFTKLWFVYNLRDRGSHWLRNPILRNRWIWASVVLCAALLAAAVYTPGLGGLLKTRPLGLAEWLLVLVASLLPVIVGQAARLITPAAAPGK